MSDNVKIHVASSMAEERSGAAVRGTALEISERDPMGTPATTWYLGSMANSPPHRNQFIQGRAPTIAGHYVDVSTPSISVAGVSVPLRTQVIHHGPSTNTTVTEYQQFYFPQ